jgi:transcriptional regulator with XRE-family HTH domain
MSLAAKLKELRQKKGQSLQQVADGVGVSKAHIWELEKGSSTNPGLELVKKLAQHFSVTVEFLLNDDAEPTDRAALQFFREFGGDLSDKDWDTLRAVAERLKEKTK